MLQSEKKRAEEHIQGGKTDVCYRMVVERIAKRQFLENVLSSTAIVGDLVVVIVGFEFAYWLRILSGLIPSVYGRLGDSPFSWGYWKLILLGWGIVFAGMLYQNLYQYEFLHDVKRTLRKFLVMLGICLFLFLGITLTVRIDPPISRLFVLCSAFVIGFLFYVWRMILWRVICLPKLNALLKRRMIVIGWSKQALRICDTLNRSSSLMHYIGWVSNDDSHDTDVKGDKSHLLGTLDMLPDILRREMVDVVILADMDMTNEKVSGIVKICEMQHVDFKMIPRVFEVFVTGLRATAIGNVSVLAVENLPLQNHANRMAKRVVDIIGSVVGLIFGVPIICILGILIYIESPGNIFFSQERVGQMGTRFKMFKLRSMKMGAEKADALNQSTLRADPRVLRIGHFMREWNLDEIPQFFNVLIGNMSLVGPRPERTYHSEKLSKEIVHYNARYSCKPGMTGWAQINGWRGNTDLAERIRFDIWYVEHWNLWLDIKIMIRTFWSQKNAY